MEVPPGLVPALAGPATHEDIMQMPFSDFLARSVAGKEHLGMPLASQYHTLDSPRTHAIENAKPSLSDLYRDVRVSKGLGR